MGWGLFDRRLSRATRILLLCSPLAYLALWGLTSALVRTTTGMAFGGEARLSGSGLYVSYSRYKIWWNSLALIAQHPWLGVGFGEFNFVWTLTPVSRSPGRLLRPCPQPDAAVRRRAGHSADPAGARSDGLRASGRRCAAPSPTGASPGRGSARCSARLRRPPSRGRSGAEVASPLPMQRAAFVMVVMVGDAQPARVPALVRVLPAARGVRVRPQPASGPTRATGRSPPPTAATSPGRWCSRRCC